MEFDNDQKTGIGATLLALVLYVWRRLKVTNGEERPLVNGQRRTFLNAIRTLQAENESLRERIIRLESESEEGRREHSKLYDRMRDMESRVRRFGQHPAP